ncbi:hypothetical protein Ssi02_30380 [Sinosporangium siamense]|uniref:Uncharacterized protein n=1 Tax=Sinosporangium siamense TaxID=1367973 RepID=A0A919V845_9ACTN|nr:hypothetical protein Ssi02_30380 [Sinosporangium siamense]
MGTTEYRDRRRIPLLRTTAPSTHTSTPKTPLPAKSTFHAAHPLSLNTHTWDYTRPTAGPHTSAPATEAPRHRRNRGYGLVVRFRGGRQ